LVDETLHSRFLIKLIHKLKPSSIDLVSDTMKKLRMRKDEEEILRIESAVKLAENVFEEFINRIKEGMTEIQLSIELRKIMIELGIEPSFDPITTSAENTSIPHLRNTNRKIHKGDIIIIDYGVKYKGYCSDITRTLSLGPPSDAFALKIFEIVRNAKDLVEDNLVEGIKGFEADKVARDYITSKGYGDKFIHRTGHGIGIDVHEPPFLSPDYNEKLENRMVFTVEPGIYFPGRFGIRLEDMVILNGRGIVLNKKQDEIIIV
ncbi:MAG: M24 family metallopeptidase, partial [Sulfolobaceae archaeon]